MKRRQVINSGRLLIVCVCAAIARGVAAEEAASRPVAQIVRVAETKWRDAVGLPAGAQIAVLDGDSAKEGSFTIRLKIPAGYRIPPHTHTTAERITIISGTVTLGIGEKFDQSGGRELKTGDFASVAPGVPHFAWATSEAVLQIQSEGPFQRKYLDANDEQPNAKK